VQSNQPQSNASEAIPVQSNQPQSNASEANNNTNQLLVTITLQKDPVARGDTQNSTIAVTDSSHRPIANAQINGKLIYPGNNFEKDFNGITDLEGKFVYSWIIGKKGDVGPLVMRVETSSQGHPLASAENTFQIVKKGESSEIKNPFQSHFQRP
jgi:outer membrane biosynthesis protein TonB